MFDRQNDNDKGEESNFWFGLKYWVDFQNLSGKNGPVALLETFESYHSWSCRICVILWNTCDLVEYMWQCKIHISGIYVILLNIRGNVKYI